MCNSEQTDKSGVTIVPWLTTIYWAVVIVPFNVMEKHVVSKLQVTNLQVAAFHLSPAKTYISATGRNRGSSKKAAESDTAIAAATSPAKPAKPKSSELHSRLVRNSLGPFNEHLA